MRKEDLVAQLAVFWYVEDVIVEQRDKRILLGTCQLSTVTNVTKDLDLLSSALRRHRQQHTFPWVALDCHQALLHSLLTSRRKSTHQEEGRTEMPHLRHDLVQPVPDQEYPPPHPQEVVIDHLFDILQGRQTFSFLK